MASRTVLDRMGFRYRLLAAWAAAHDGNVGELSFLRAEIVGMSDRLGIEPHWLRALTEGAPPPDPWCAATLYRMLARFTQQASPVLAERLAGRSAGPLVVGPYVLHRPLASGGVGTVWDATHALTGRSVAVKLLRAMSGPAVEHFQAEIDIVSRLDHPAIVTVLDVVEVGRIEAEASRGVLAEGQQLLVMERVDHGTLADHLGQLPWREVQAVLLALLDGLSYAHAHGVLHRDLKPANVLVGEGNALRLADFGLSGLGSGQVAGTPLYMAPEQFRRGAVGPEADLYALGCMGWALATGHPPFQGTVVELAAAHQGQPVPAFLPATPVADGFEAWLRRCLSKQPDQRYRSAAAAGEALMALSDHPTAPATAVVAPPSASVTPTFVLDTLMDLPAPTGTLPRNEGPTATEGLHDIFEDRRSWRPRLPTPRLRDRGDPPVLFRRTVQQALWDLLARVLARGSQRVVLRGGGGRTLIRWLVRRARMSGRTVADAPTPGVLSIVDGTELSPERLAAPASERWLIITCNRPMPDARVLRLPDLSPAQVWAVTTCRVPLGPTAAAQVATEAVGAPELALALLEDALDAPGVEMSTGGLELLGPPRPGPRAGAIWRGRVPQVGGPARLLAQHLAITPSAADGHSLRRLAPEGPPLPMVAIGVNDAWRAPMSLRDMVLRGVPRATLQALHAEAMVTALDPFVRAAHRCHVEPVPERVAELVEVGLGRRLDRAQREAVRLHLDMLLVPAPEMRTWLALAERSTEELGAITLHDDRALAERAACVLADRVQPLPEPAYERLERDLLRPRRPGWTLRLAHVVAQRLRRRGQVERALQLVERLEGALPADARPRLMWLRGRLQPGLEAIACFERALATPGVPWDVAMDCHIDISEDLLDHGRPTEALAHLDASKGTWSEVAAYNRVVALLALGNDREAQRQVEQVLPVMMQGLNARLFDGLTTALLALTRENAPAMWATFRPHARRIHDPMLREALRPRVEWMAPGPYRRELLALLEA